MQWNLIELSHICFSGEDRPTDVTSGSVREASLGMTWTGDVNPGRGGRETVAPLLRDVLAQSGVEPDCYKPKVLNRRLAASLRALRMPSEETARTAIELNPELRQTALSALLIGVSAFFRDPEVFEYLRTVVIPGVLEEGDVVRVYSVGCSAGQELYSVGMILDELGALDRSQLMGVDCRLDAIAQARSGWFVNSDLEFVANDRAQRYFTMCGRRASICSRLRQRMEWRLGDFRGYREQAAWDLVLFRNVAIYLEPERARVIWQQVVKQLKPGGILVTGKAERPPPMLELKQESASVFRRVKGHR